MSCSSERQGSGPGAHGVPQPAPEQPLCWAPNHHRAGSSHSPQIWGAEGAPGPRDSPSWVPQSPGGCEHQLPPLGPQLGHMGSALPKSSSPVNPRAPGMTSASPRQGHPVPSLTSESEGRPAAWPGTPRFTANRANAPAVGLSQLIASLVPALSSVPQPSAGCSHRRLPPVERGTGKPV